MKRIAIIGLGLIGQERLRAIEILRLRKLPVAVTALCDLAENKIEVLDNGVKLPIYTNIDHIIAQKPDLTIVAVPHDVAAEITKKFLTAGLDVLIEKPMGRSFIEAQEIFAACLKPEQLHIAHNYRFFPGVAALLQDIQCGAFGTPISFSLLLGHGGKPTDKESWKLNKLQAGGGALLDPGIHLIDLCQLIDNDIELIGGLTWDGFWKTGIEEECHMILRGQKIPMIDLKVSIVRWRSTFRLEFFGTDGYGIVEGRGKTYGAQSYRRGKRWGWQSGKSQSGQSQIESEELVLTSDCDETFADELESLLFLPETDSIKKPCSGIEALANMKTLDILRAKII